MDFDLDMDIKKLYFYRTVMGLLQIENYHKKFYSINNNTNGKNGLVG